MKISCLTQSSFAGEIFTAIGFAARRGIVALGIAGGHRVRKGQRDVD